MHVAIQYYIMLPRIFCPEKPSSSSCRWKKDRRYYYSNRSGTRVEYVGVIFSSLRYLSGTRLSRLFPLFGKELDCLLTSLVVNMRKKYCNTIQ